jgi:ABC-type bacteriocin/lantibiotic exporter with double-glycine peptidase domain
MFNPGMVEGNRLVPIASSDVYSALNEMLEGATTISAFGQTDRFSKKSNKNLDILFGATFSTQTLEMWLRERIVLLTATISLGIGLLGCYLAKSYHRSAEIGLALAYVNGLAASVREGLFDYGFIESKVFFDKG